ncbi:universal stress protein [Streptomyces sp. NPDC088354]|uniref:universal stress protein n=1 Tax=unclassified Streptomyces TaxID=2593676 RepID=UPI0029B348CA|nr:universal stress protein [Streptomyces sp. MI02-7b]MDX3077788.1 universal stress protein [Streptomyces sp. MI02-7b]
MSLAITAGVDGSPAGLAAADWAAREARLRGLPLVLVHVHDWQPRAYTYAPLAGGIAPLDAGTQAHWAERTLRDAATDLGRRHPGLEISTRHLGGEPAAVLAATAQESELLVLGSRGLGPVTGFLVGSVASATVARAARPVVLVRAGGTEGDPTSGRSDAAASRDVVLGLDLTRPSEELVSFAFEAASLRRVPLRVVHGWNLPPAYGYDAGAAYAELQKEIAVTEAGALAQALLGWREKYPSVAVSEHSLLGGAVPLLLDAAADACLVVVGRRIRRSAAGMHVGPVAHAMLHHCAVPVAVVPHA